MSNFEDIEDIEDEYVEYEDPHQDITRVANMDFFEPSERHHIAQLIRKRDSLRETQRNTKNFKASDWNLLNALNWALALIEEVEHNE